MCGKKSTLAVFSFVACHLLFGVACSETQEHTAPAVNPHDSASVMKSYGVNMLVSDSGVIKYRIVAERWEVNEIRQPNRWEFMKGIFLEQFDETFHVEAHIQADTAWYYTKEHLWKLRGRVNIRNVKGLIYTSEELYWDGMKHEFYSTVFSRVVTPERTMEGTYFRSDERMERYMVTNSKGSFLASDIESDDGGAVAPAGTDSTSQSRQGPMRHRSFN